MILGGALFFLFFFYLYPYHLYHREQTSIFVLSAQTLTDYLDKPAFLSCLVGDFLTQFFYYQGIGPLIISVLLIALGAVYYRLLYRKQNWWALIPVTLLTLWEFGKLCSMYYPISATLSFMGGGLIALLFIRIHTKLHSNKAAIPLAMVCIAISYWLFGIGVWITLIFIFTYLSRFVMLLLFVEAICISLAAKHLYTIPWDEAFFYPSTTQFGAPNMERERILKYDCEYYFNRTSRLQDETISPNGILPTYYAHLIDAKQRNLPNNLLARMKYDINGLFIPVAPTSAPQSIYAANEVWFELGDMTMAEHATMLGMIFSPYNKGSRALKRLAEINLINHDDEAAKKYLRMLQKTIAHYNWAEERMPGIHSERVQQWLNVKRNFIPRTDVIRNSADIQTSLCNLLDANPNNLLALDYLLCYDLLIKDINSFGNHLEKYSNGYSNHRLYQEAYLIYATGQDSPFPKNEKIVIEPEVIDNFYQYTKLYQSEEDNVEQLKQLFDKTYWFYYHFAQKNN